MTDHALDIGETEDGEPFRLPAEIGIQANATLGKRGTGKTVTATVLVEEMLKRGMHVVVIDPVDVWWGLKSDAGGEEEGFPILTMGGSHGDLPLEADQGSYLADFAVEKRVPMILSLRHLRKNKQRSFVTEFAEQLYHRKGEPEHRVPLHLVVDEASRFIPQQVRGNMARSVGAFEDIVRQGRADGFGVNLIDQRPATVNKDVLSQVDTLVVHQVTSPHDRKALTDWVEQHDSGSRKQRFLDRLASLDTGQAWFWDAGLDVFELVNVRMRETFDSSRTPDLGEEVTLPEKMASVDIDELRDELAETIEEAEKRDPDHLRERVRELEEERKELIEEVEAAQGRVPADHGCEGAPEDYVPHDTMVSQIEAAVKSARREVREEMKEKVARASHDAAWGVHDRWREWAEEAREALLGYQGVIHELERVLDETAEERELPDVPPPPDGDLADVEEEGRSARKNGRSSESFSSRSTPSDRSDLSGPEVRVLDALRTYDQLGRHAVEREALAAMAEYKPSGHFNNVVADLKKKGLAEYPSGGKVAITDAGRRLALMCDLESLEDVHDLWLGLASGPEATVLRQLLEAYPGSLSREELADRSGYSTSGHFSNIVGSLRSWGAAEYPEPGRVRASGLLFPDELQEATT